MDSCACDDVSVNKCQTWKVQDIPGLREDVQSQMSQHRRTSQQPLYTGKEAYSSMFKSHYITQQAQLTFVTLLGSRHRSGRFPAVLAAF